MAVVTPIDRPKSIRNRCVIEHFGGVFAFFTLLFRIVWYRGLAMSLHLKRFPLDARPILKCL